MMKLTRCTFAGLEGFETLDLADLKDLTILTGPNGAGKSSILQVLKLALELLGKKTVCDQPPSHDRWHRFSMATLYFTSSEPVSLNHFGGHFGEVSGEVVLEISLNEQRFEIQNIRSDQVSVSFSSPQISDAAIGVLRSQADDIARRKQEIEARITTLTNQMRQAQSSHQPQQVQQFQQNLDQANKELRSIAEAQTAKQAEIDEKSLVSLQLSGDEQPHRFGRAEVQNFLAALSFPSVEHVDARQLYENAIPRMISQLLVEKKGRRQENEKYSRAVLRLEHLVQSQVEVSDINGTEDMHVNGVQYKKASSGTQITLSFFGLTRLGEQNCIILWDEPENGLHPTRRARLLELMFADGRQFILATHAAEFAPVFSEKGKVFRCEANFDTDNTAVRLGVQRVADRRDAFIALEALGVHPARALFTANVVIWVEGPTELVFYRHWLVPRLNRRGLHEGFHYTFMQYGGALVSYLTIADDSQFESTFDLLSMCRHPILIVDSDLREAPGTREPLEFLKRGAARLLAEVEKLNSERHDAALFAWTSGREVENYLPEAAIWYAVSSVWQGFKNHETELISRSLQVGQYDSYEDALEKHFDAVDVVNVDKDDATKRAAKGRSLWGAGNKVEMMRAALNMPGLAESQLKWGCSSLLQRVEEFVVSISER